MLATYRPAAFSEPTYSGSLELAPKLIGPARDATDRIDDFRASLEQIVDGTVRAYTSLQTSPLGDDAIRVLHISDIHASPLGMEFALQVARGFEADMVLDTGDITSFATPVENLIVLGIREFDVPVRLRSRKPRFPRAPSGDRPATERGRPRRAGAGDRRAARSTGSAIPHSRRREECPSTTRRSRSSRASAGARDRGRPRRDGGTRRRRRRARRPDGRVRGGPDPSGPLRPFPRDERAGPERDPVPADRDHGRLGAGIFRGLDLPFTAEVLYFSRGEDPELIAYDVIEQQADSGSLTVHRITVSEEYGELVPTPSPTAGTPSPTPDRTATTGSPTGATGSS